MEPLALLNQFFLFSVRDWSLWGEQLSSLAGIEQFFRRPIFPPRVLRVSPPPSLLEAEKSFARIQANFSDINSCAYFEPEYPKALLKFLPPEELPPLLFWRGTLPDTAEALCIVGTRSNTSEGAYWAKGFAEYFLSAGFLLGSGMAKGIDSIVHSADPGRTFAIVGGCPSDVYPRENKRLAETILREGGALLSPYPPTSAPLPQNFPYRNRWLAALTSGTLVIEGGERSGALVTARWALAMDKPVVTLARNFDSEMGRGAISLVESGASLARDPKDALHQLWGARPWPRKDIAQGLP